MSQRGGTVITRGDDKTGEIIVSSGAKLTLKGDFTVSHNANLNGAHFIRVEEGGSLVLDASLAANAPNTEHGNQNTDKNGEYIQSFIDCSGSLTMNEGSKVTGWTQDKQADRHNVNYDPGAAIRITGENASFVMNGGEITGNTNIDATNSIVGSTVQIMDGASFVMNGGSISGNGSSVSAATRDNATLGGGVYVSGSSFEMHGGEITGNEARNGGGVYLTGASTFLMTGGRIAENLLCLRNSIAYGGGVYVGSDCTFQIKSADADNPATIEDNTLYTTGSPDSYYQYVGGGIYVYKGSLSIENGKISGNKALVNNGHGGGGIYASGAEITITDSVISGNASYYDESTVNRYSYGGGIGLSSSTLAMSGSEVSGNQSCMYGGGIYASGSELSLSDCILKENVALKNGGALCLVSWSSLSINDTSVIENEASDGGGLYLERMNKAQKTVFDDTVKITGNTAEGMGGGIYVNTDAVSGVEINGSIITGNRAGDGAGVVNSGDEMVMNGGLISGNEASSTSGGVLNCFGGTFTMNGGLIINNKAGDAGNDVGNYATTRSAATFTLPNAGGLGITGISAWFEDGSQDGSVPRYEGHETEVPQYTSFNANKEWHMLTLGEIYEVSFVTNCDQTLGSQLVAKGTALSCPQIENEGYVLSGWYRDEGLTQIWKFDSDVVTEDIILYAGWEEEKQTEPGGSTEDTPPAGGNGATDGSADVDRTTQKMTGVETGDTGMTLWIVMTAVAGATGVLAILLRRYAKRR